MIPLVIKATSVAVATAELAKRGLHANKINRSLPWPTETYAEVEDTPDALAKVRAWFHETVASDACPIGGLLFYRYGDDA